MKILFLDQFGEPGGGQRCLLDLLPAIRDQGWSACVAAPPSGPLLDLARASGAETAPIPLSVYGIGRKSVLDAVRFAIDTPRLARWIAQQASDLIYVNGPRLLAAAALGASGRPVIFHAHHFFLQASARAVANWAVQHAGATVIANSHHVAAQFRGAAKLHVVYNGVNPLPFVARKFGEIGTWRIGIIGRIAPMKGQSDFLGAAALLDRQRSCRFVICGEPMFSDEAYSRKIRKLAEGLPVEFLGWREDVGAVLADLDLLIVPSTRAEATTRVILEAFSTGTPVVAYAVGGIPEIVQDSINGFLVQKCEPYALAPRILEAMNADLAGIGERAHCDYMRKFRLETWRSEILSIIASISAAMSPTNGDLTIATVQTAASVVRHEN